MTSCVSVYRCVAAGMFKVSENVPTTLVLNCNIRLIVMGLGC